MKFNRNDPISIEIKDPDNPEEIDPINSSVVVGDDLFIIKENSIYRILTAETIDPKNQHPDTKHSYEKIFDLGSSSPYVARVIIQFEKLIKFLSFNQSKRKDLLSYLWNANQYLLNSFECDKSIVEEATELLSKCSSIIEKHKNSSSIPALPQIPDLENKVRIYLNNAKLFLIESFRLLNIFYEMPFDGRKAAHFKSHLEWVKKNLGKEHSITKVISQDLEWIRLISECRNALEHPEEGQEIKIRNIALYAGNKFSGPAWSYDLRKKLDIQFDSVDLINDLSVFSHNMLHFFEELFLICVDENITHHKLLVLSRIPEDKINKKCPIKYTVTLKNEFIKK
jgi:hypothetical protein